MSLDPAIDLRFDRLERLLKVVLKRLNAMERGFSRTPVEPVNDSLVLETPMKLTPRQNQIISEQVAEFAVRFGEAFDDTAAEKITRLRRLLVAELALVTAETDQCPVSEAAGIRG
jgi:hypothetical protein